jgi:D-beta-D-heptose 7-phosphate kinase/D-beta-D-heptose 1-phosphate adenosyltransferase
MSNYRTKRIVVASGYFNPLHKGHIEYLQRSRELGDQLIVIVNNDEQVRMKKGYVLLSAEDRIKVVRELECVDMAIESVDKTRSVVETLKLLHPHVFTNGGDQTNDSIPEAEYCRTMGIELVDGLGEKIESSSDIVNRAIINA